MLKLATTTAFLILAAGAVQAQTVEYHYKYLHEKCRPSLKMEKAGCDCIITAAKKNLTEAELEFVVMYVKKNKPEIKRLQGIMNGNQVLKAKAFVRKTPNACRPKTEN